MVLDVLPSIRTMCSSVFSSSHMSPINQSLKLCNRFFAPRMQPHGHPVHLHRHHKTSQQGQPVQFQNQPWRSKQHCHRQDHLNHFPNKKSTQRGARILRTLLTPQTTQKNKRRNHHSQRTISRRPSRNDQASDQPSQQGHQHTDQNLSTKHPPGRHLGHGLLQRLGFFCTQPLEVFFFGIIFDRLPRLKQGLFPQIITSRLRRHL